MMMMETITMMMMSSGAVGVLFIYFVNLLGHFGTLIGLFETPLGLCGTQMGYFRKHLKKRILIRV